MNFEAKYDVCEISWRIMCQMGLCENNVLFPIALFMLNIVSMLIVVTYLLMQYSAAHNMHHYSLK